MTITKGNVLNISDNPAEWSDADDAFIHGLTVEELPKRHQEEYYQYLVKQYFDNVMSSEHFASLVGNYVSTSPSQ
jgi:hypothetical protein